MPDTNPQQTTPPQEIIVCRVTRWYYRRMGLLTAMFIGMGLYFFYDGKWGYPKKNQIAEKKDWFEKEIVGTGETPAEGSYEAAKAKGPDSITQWMAEARAQKWVISPQMQEPRWDDYAAPHGWPSTPKKYSTEEIEQQFWWGAVVIAAGIFTGILILTNRKKTFTGYPEHMLMPDGREVRYDQVFKIDKRKWDNKGLAYAYYKSTENNASKKAVIDDLKFGGADKILTRLLSNFSGELIEKIIDPEDTPTNTAEPTSSESTPPN